MQDKRLCIYCAHKDTDWCNTCGTDEDNNTLFEPKCCANCGRYIRGRCLAIEDWAYTHTGAATVCLKDPTDYCSEWEPEEE